MARARRRRTAEGRHADCGDGSCANGGHCVSTRACNREIPVPKIPGNPGNFLNNPVPVLHPVVPVLSILSALVSTGRGRVCACAGAWGGARCEHYVGHDHACAARACAPPALCVWGPDRSETEPGAVYCACLEGASCTAPHVAVPEVVPAGAGGAAGAAGAGAGGGAWAGAVLAVLSLLAAALAALYLLHRRRHGAFVHARLSDNVEINNPMYLAGEDELDPPQHNHTHNNGGNHFANPVYDSMYAPQQNNPAEEHANLLAERALDASPTPERAALL